MSEVFVSPYDELIPGLFNRINRLDEIDEALPVNWREMFRPEFLRAVESNPRHPVRVALRDNDLLNFTPQTPLLMFYCTMDEQVDFRNALVARFVYGTIRKSPANISAIWAGPFDHAGICVPVSLALARLNFEGLRTF